MLTIWPVSNHLAPLTVFVIINGAANGGFFSSMPTVVGSVFGSARVGVKMGMIITGWAGGYLMVCPVMKKKERKVTSRRTRLADIYGVDYLACIGSTNRRISARRIWWRARHSRCISSCHVLCWFHDGRSL